jgi:hypothetical protein
MYELARFNRLIQSEQGEPPLHPQPMASNLHLTTTREERQKRRQLTFAVRNCNIVCLSFLVFGVMTLLSVVMVLVNPHEEEEAVWRLFKAVMNLMLFVNSSVKFVIYYLVVAKFQNLLSKRLGLSV